MSAFVAVFERMIDTLEESGETQLVDRAQEEWHMERKEREELQARVIASLSPPTGKVLVDVEKLREIEWVSTATRVGITVCPVCGGSRDCGGHADNACWLAKLLKENHAS